MSLFKERVASSKKIVALENEIISLKQHLASTRPVKDDTKALASLKAELSDLKVSHATCETKLLESQALFEAAVEEVSDLKADLKKVRSENTRLKKKLKSPEDFEENVHS